MPWTSQAQSLRRWRDRRWRFLRELRVAKSTSVGRCLYGAGRRDGGDEILLYAELPAGGEKLEREIPQSQTDLCAQRCADPGGRCVCSQCTDATLGSTILALRLRFDIRQKSLQAARTSADRNRLTR